jgi:chemotaxis protein MotA
MRASTLIGIVVGLVAIFGAFLWEGGTVDALFMLPAMLIVFGGTLAAGLAGTSFGQMAKMPRLFFYSLNPKQYDTKAIVNQIVEFSYIARREGILSLESRLDEVEHPFLRKLFGICIDGVDPDSLKNIVESEVEHISERHEANIGLFSKLGGYSPTMGIIGTVMGLIATLAAAGEDPNVLIRHISSAFIATMWGILMANIVWLPIADKLRTLHNAEMELFSIMLDGTYSIQAGEMPSVIRAKLASAFPLKEQDDLLQPSEIAAQFKDVKKEILEESLQVPEVTEEIKIEQQS